MLEGRVTVRRSHHFRIVRAALSVVVAALAPAGCLGVVQDAVPETPPAPRAAGVDPGTGRWSPASCDPGETAFSAARIWQITDEEYVNMVRDVLGIGLTGAQAEITSGSDGAGEFSNFSDTGVVFNDNMAQNYERAAQDVARLATAAPKMQALVGSAAAATPDQLEGFIQNKVARLWRRPVEADEVSALKALYTGALDGGPAAAFGVLLQAVLQSPSFLFRTELGPGSGERPLLTAYETVTAISMLFLESAPDDALWARAQDGTISSPEVLAREVDRLMALPAAQENLARKVSYWLWTERVPDRDKDTTLFDVYTPAVRDSVYRSGRAFVKDVVSSGKLWDLFSSSKMFVNKDISTVYGIPGGTSATLTAVTTTRPERSAGILSQPAFLAAAHKRAALSDPIHLGLFVFEQLLCGGDVGAIPDPPADAFEQAAMMMGTERELVAKRAELSCGACHKFDTFGLAFQSYDAIGRFSPNRQVVKDASGKPVWQATATPIDSSTVIPETVGPDLKGPLSGVADLAARLNSDGPNRRVATCAARWLTRYALGTDADTLNACDLQKVWDRFYKSGSFTDLFRGLATSPGFVTRIRR